MGILASIRNFDAFPAAPRGNGEPRKFILRGRPIYFLVRVLDFEVLTPRHFFTSVGEVPENSAAARFNPERFWPPKANESVRAGLTQTNASQPRPDKGCTRGLSGAPSLSIWIYDTPLAGTSVNTLTKMLFRQISLYWGGGASLLRFGGAAIEFSRLRKLPSNFCQLQNKNKNKH